MKEFFKKNFVVILSFALPILLIVIVALSVYLPSFFLSTNYNFIYSVCTNGTNYSPYQCNNYLQKNYSVVKGKIVANSTDSKQDLNKDGVPDINKSYNARIFLYDTKKKESREITLEEAQALSLNELLTSPDGVTVSSNYDRGGDDFLVLFDRGASYGYYLAKGKSKNKINLINSDDRYYYRDNFQFIGWVLPGRK